jgi:adenylate cyclase class 2
VIEVEIKLRFATRNPYEVIDQLPAMEWSAPITQIDQIFLMDGGDRHSIVPGTRILRIRREHRPEQDERITINLKVQQEVALASIEYETTVGDPEAARDMILALQFDPFVEVHKVRRTASVDSYSLCIDYVERLGTFLEVEQLVESGDPAELQGSMTTWIESFGLTGYELTNRPYDRQVYDLDAQPTT